MTKTQLEIMLAELLKQNAAQAELISLLTSRQNTTPAEPLKQKEPRETSEAKKERDRNNYEQMRARILRRYSPSPKNKSSRIADYDEFVQEYEYEALYEVSEHLLYVLLCRMLNKTIADAFAERMLKYTTFRNLVALVDFALKTELEQISDEDRAAAAEREKEVAATAENKERALLPPSAGSFSLPGRHELERFFNEHVVDIVNNHAIYRELGVEFPQPFVLEGPPGCGKTFAVERLAEHLGWPVHRISSGTIGSTYIHDTAKKTEEIFAKAAEEAPALIIIDEMEAFMPDRSRLSPIHHHNTEEVGAFLRCLQTAAEKKILVIGMTNHISRIDPAILRTGRLSAHITVGMPVEEEIEEVLRSALAHRPHEDFPLTPIARQLLDRPLSDITYTVNLAALATARARRTRITADDLTAALDTLTQQQNMTQQHHTSIGFAAAV